MPRLRDFEAQREARREADPMSMWGHDALMGIRRELDDQGNTVNLRQMLYEMADRPEVLTRRRYLSFLTPDDDDFMEKMLDRGFDKFGVVAAASGDRLDDHINAAAITKDRLQLEAATDTAFRYAQMMVAHRAPVDKLEIQIADIHAAIDAIEPVLQKYYCILNCVSIGTATPTIQYDWMEPFKLAWYVPPKESDGD